MFPRLEFVLEVILETIPLTWLVTALMAIACAAVGQSAGLPVAARVFLAGFLACLGVIGALLGSRLSFGAQWAGTIQPLVAVLVAPLAYLGFRALMVDRSYWTTSVLSPHGALVLLCQVAILGSPILPDFVVLAVTSAYLFGLVTLARRGSDAFIHVSAHAMPVLRTAIMATMVLLALIILADSALFVLGAVKGTAYALTVLGGASGVFAALVFIVVLVGAAMVPRRLGRAERRRGDPVSPSREDRLLLGRINAVLRDGKLYQDSSLTVARMARRLGVPARDVTNAINRCAARSFSRHVNEFRIQHACRMLRETALSVTEIMLDSGFVSKSSFNAEFRRILGRTPSQFRAEPDNGASATTPIAAKPRP